MTSGLTRQALRRHRWAFLGPFATQCLAASVITAKSAHIRSRNSWGWLGREDSNLRIREPKSRALPLGHAPSRLASAYPRLEILLALPSVAPARTPPQVRSFDVSAKG